VKKIIEQGRESTLSFIIFKAMNTEESSSEILSNSIRSRRVTSKSSAPALLAGNYGKLPPQAVDLEEAILGALMLEKDALTAVIDILHPESFYKDTHKTIFLAIRRLFERSEPIDILTVTNELKKTGELDIVGGPFAITQLDQPRSIGGKH
jgi:replicative DNA helicase